MSRDIELAWPGTRLIGRHWFPDSGWPVGAFFWRFVGEAAWQPIPGRHWDKESRRGTIDGDELQVLHRFVENVPSALDARM